MPDSLRLLIVADLTTGARILTALREADTVRPALAPDRDVLTTLLRTREWDGIVVSANHEILTPGDAAAVTRNEAPWTPLFLWAPDGAGADRAQHVVDEARRAAAARAEKEAQKAIDSSTPETSGIGSSESGEGEAELAETAGAETIGDDGFPPELSEAERHASRFSIHSLAQHLPVGVYRSLPNGRVLYSNPALARILGCDRVRELEGLDVKEDLGYPRETFEREIQKTGSVTNLVVRWVDRCGRLIYTRENAHAVTDDANRILYYEGVIEDVTEEMKEKGNEQREARRSLRRQSVLADLAVGGDESAHELIERAVRGAVEAAELDRADVWMVEGDWLVCRASHVADERFAPAFSALSVEDYDSILQELKGRRALSIDDTSVGESVKRLGMTEFVEKYGIRGFLFAPIRRACEAVGLIAFYKFTEATPWSDAEGEFAAGVADAVALALERDERANVETALRHSEKRYRALAEMMSDYAFAVHRAPDGSIHLPWATDAVERVFGVDPESIRDLAIIDDFTYPESRDDVKRAFAGLADGQNVNFEVKIQAGDGETRWVHHRARRVPPPQGEEDVVVSIHCGRDITDSKISQQRIVEARKEAEELAKLKGAFLANMSHEIRTPLTSILGYADLLEEEVNSEGREYVDLVQRSGMRLLEVLNSVLDLARLEADGVTPHLQPTDVTEEAEKAVSMLRPLAERKGLTLRLIADDPVVASLDAACLGRIFANLIGNAIKFTDEGGVEMRVDEVGGQACIQIEDTGRGIAEDFLPHLFDEFRQGSSGDDRSHDGSGLGLSITRRLTGLMNGEIEVESEQEKGTTFTLYFPLADVDAEVVRSASGANGVPTAYGTYVDESVSRGTASALGNERTDGFSGLDSMLGEGTRSEIAASEKSPEDGSLRTEPLGSGEAPPPDALPDEGTASESTKKNVAADVALRNALLNDAEPTFEPIPDQEGASEINGEERLRDAEPAETVVGAEPGPGWRTLAATSDEAEVSVAALRANSNDKALFPPAGEQSASSTGRRPVANSSLHSSPPPGPVTFRSDSDAPLPASGPEPDPEKLSSDDTERPSSETDPSFTFVARPAPDEDSGEPKTRARRETADDDKGADTPSNHDLEEADDDRPKLLIVEDNSDTRTLLLRILRKAYHVRAVGTAREALSEMNVTLYDGLVMDINLGGKKTGADVLRVARTLPGYEDVFAIALTAYALPGDRERLLEGGFNEYISKPFSRHSLVEALERGIAR